MTLAFRKCVCSSHMFTSALVQLSSHAECHVDQITHLCWCCIPPRVKKIPTSIVTENQGRLPAAEHVGPTSLVIIRTAKSELWWTPCYWYKKALALGLGHNNNNGVQLLEHTRKLVCLIMSSKQWLTLGSGEAVLGPAVRVSVEVQQCVLLLDAEPRHVSLHLFHDRLARNTLVRFWKGQ